MNKVVWDFMDKVYNGGWLFCLFGFVLVVDVMFMLLFGSGVWEGRFVLVD